MGRNWFSYWVICAWFSQYLSLSSTSPRVLLKQINWVDLTVKQSFVCILKPWMELKKTPPAETIQYNTFFESSFAVWGY